MGNWTAVRLPGETATRVYVGERLVGLIDRLPMGEEVVIHHVAWEQGRWEEASERVDFDQACEELVSIDREIEDNNKRILEEETKRNK